MNVSQNETVSKHFYSQWKWCILYINRLLFLCYEPLVCFRNETKVSVGFVGSDCISQKTLHLYSGDGTLGDAIQVEELLRDVGDKQGTEQFRYLAAAVVTSLSISKNSSQSQKGKLSWPLRGNLRDLYVRKITFCYICMKPLLILRS